MLVVAAVILIVTFRCGKRKEKLVTTPWKCPNATWACPPGMKQLETQADQSQNHNWFCLGDSSDYLMPRLRRICEWAR